MENIPHWPKSLGIGIVALVVMLLAAGVAKNWNANAQLQQKLAELRAAGEPLGLADLAHIPIRAETNAAFFLSRAKNDVDAIYKHWEPTYRVKINEDEMDAGRLTPEMRDAIRSAFEAHPQAITMLQRAADCTEYDPQLDSTVGTQKFMEAMLDRMQDTRMIIRVLDSRVLLLLSDGKQDEALDTSLLMFRLCRHFDRDPMIVSYLVALACHNVAVRAADRVLRSGPLPNTARDALEAELALHDGDKSYQRALSTDRAFGLETLREWSAQGLFGPLALSWIFPSLKNDQRGYLDFMEGQINAASRPYSDRSTGASALANAGVWANLLAPATQAMYEAKCRTQAEIRCLRILNALGRLESASAIAEPPKLADLGLPAAATTDPYNLAPLHVKKLPDGWLVYSVGKDLIDGGGNDLGPSQGEDVGLGPARPKSETKPNDDNE